MIQASKTGPGTPGGAQVVVIWPCEGGSGPFEGPLGLGDKERALELIEGAAATPHLFYAGNADLANGSRLDPLRSDPRFQRALERVGFPEAIVRRR